MSVCAMPPFDEAHVLAIAALASSDGGQDPVDAAIRARAPQPGYRRHARPSILRSIRPWAEALGSQLAPGGRCGPARAQGSVLDYRVTVSAVGSAASIVDGLEAKGFRVLAVAAGPPGALALAGLIALSDPPRDESAGLVAELRDLGVRTVMVTGDARMRAETVAASVGIQGTVWAGTPLPDTCARRIFRFLRACFRRTNTVSSRCCSSTDTSWVCAATAQTMRRRCARQMGIAVSTATDVAKSAAGVVLTEPGLGGIVALVKEGRTTFQRILTYTLRSIIYKIVQVLFLAAG